MYSRNLIIDIRLVPNSQQCAKAKYDHVDVSGAVPVYHRHSLTVHCTQTTVFVP